MVMKGQCPTRTLCVPLSCLGGKSSQHCTRSRYDRSSRPDWIGTMNDMAHFYRQFIEVLGLAPVHLMGSSMGGWLAAELVAMCPAYVKSLILVDAAGIKPQVGEIAEILMVSPDVTQKLRFYDPSQVPDYDALVNRQLTPEEQEM